MHETQQSHKYVELSSALNFETINKQTDTKFQHRILSF